MEYKNLLVKKKDGVAIITLNRPQKLNAINHETRLEFLELLDALEVDNEVRVLIVTGAGRAFCAGADISEFGKMDSDPTKKGIQTKNTAKRLFEFKKPIIGAINGVSAGDGSQWLLAFDLNVASSRATIGWPATKLGIL